MQAMRMAAIYMTVSYFAVLARTNKSQNLLQINHMALVQEKNEYLETKSFSFFFFFSFSFFLKEAASMFAKSPNAGLNRSDIRPWGTCEVRDEARCVPESTDAWSDGSDECSPTS
jgi:hypothetical protein